jgi:E1A/CREB-binding protein
VKRQLIRGRHKFWSSIGSNRHSYLIIHFPTSHCMLNQAHSSQNKTARHMMTRAPIPIPHRGNSELTEPQRRERRRNVQMHMTLLLHTVSCCDTCCVSANCSRMKAILRHRAGCQIKARGGCLVCSRIWALIQIHAGQCKNRACLVPDCRAVRERMAITNPRPQQDTMNRHVNRGNRNMGGV